MIDTLKNSRFRLVTMEMDEHNVAKQRESDCIISNRVSTKIIEEKYIYLQGNGHISN